MTAENTQVLLHTYIKKLMIWYVNLVKLDSYLTLAHLFENLCTSVSKLYLVLLSSISWIQNVGLKVTAIQNEFKELVMHRQIVC